MTRPGSCYQSTCVLSPAVYLGIIGFLPEILLGLGRISLVHFVRETRYEEIDRWRRLSVRDVTQASA